jgi:hypothetical protein
MGEIQIENNAETGFPRNVLSSVVRRISSLTRRNKVSKFKIGITSDPSARAKSYGDSFDRMVLVYETSSYQNVTLLEKLLIQHNAELSENIVNGGGGRKGTAPYFLYVVLQTLE